MHHGADASGALEYPASCVYTPYQLAARYRLWAFGVWEPQSRSAGNQAWSVVEDAVAALPAYRDALMDAARGNVEVHPALSEPFCVWCCDSLLRTGALSTCAWTTEQTAVLTDRDKGTSVHRQPMYLNSATKTS